jgi:hypothetical protein
MQATAAADACQEYLSQLVDRFCTEYGRGSSLAVWALEALEHTTKPRDSEQM